MGRIYKNRFVMSSKKDEGKEKEGKQGDDGEGSWATKRGKPTLESFFWIW